MVFFAMLPDAAAQGDGFGVEFEWDIPLLEGYRYQVLENASRRPGVTHFSGCDTPGIQAELKSLNPDAVIVNGWVVKTCLQALWACKRLQIPCLVRGEANDLSERPAWKRILQRILVKQYDACLYIGQASKAFYEARGIASNRLFPAHYCIESQRFERAAQALQKDRLRLRNNWNIPGDSTCFIYCGKFEPKKHPVELIESFRAANELQSNLHLLMVGDGELRQRCEEEASKRQLPVTFTGFLNQSEIISAYVAADCLVLCSDAGETWGLVVNEAMACSRPALVSDLAGCHSDLIKAGTTGDVFSFGDWDELARRMADLGANRANLAAMGELARKRVELYSPEAAAQGMLDSVISTLQDRDPGT